MASIDLVRPLGGDWAASAALYPAISARLGDQSSLAASPATPVTAWRFLRASIRRRTRRQPRSATYRGLSDHAVYARMEVDPTHEFARKMAILDAQTGPRAYDDESGITEPIASYRWICASREEMDDLRKFFYARKGRLKAIWVPTWVDDVKVVATIGSASTNSILNTSATTN